MPNAHFTAQNDKQLLNMNESSNKKKLAAATGLDHLVGEGEGVGGPQIIRQHRNSGTLYTILNRLSIFTWTYQLSY